MRASVCIFALVLAVPVAFATNAEAKIKPVPRPEKVIGKPAAASRGSAIAPLAKPVAHARKVVHAKGLVGTKPAARTTTRKLRAPVRSTTHRRTRGTTANRVHRVRVLARSRGGRYVPPARSRGGRRQPPPLPVVPAPPTPTPLGFVARGELLPSSGDPWPSWVSSLLAVMAAFEIYLLVHLARRRSFA